MDTKKIVKGNIVDIHNRKIFSGEIVIENQKIKSIKPINEVFKNFILPGFIDSHVHIESSMASPAEFGRAVIKHGTVATLSDPHEIANVLGVLGVDAMIENAKHAPIKIFFGAPSCVPATPFETSGAEINASETRTLMQRDDIYFLSEMMNYPGVLNNDQEVMLKIAAAKENNKPVDGHAPGLSGDDARKYAQAGISTDHESYDIDNALDKIEAGIKIQIREGSAAKNFDELIPLMREYPDMLMLCSDDLHPDDLMKGHIDILVRKAVNLGYDFFDVIRAAALTPVQHYNIPVGTLKINDPADFIVVDNLKDFNTLQVFIDGEEKYQAGKPVAAVPPIALKNNFNTNKISLEELIVPGKEGDKINVIGASNGSLITTKLIKPALISNGSIVSNIDDDILKIVVKNRYKNTPPAIGFIHGFGLRNGAIASSVAHDSHNIIAIGTNDTDICEAINTLIEHHGGICCSENGEVENMLPLPFGGLMSNKSIEDTSHLFYTNSIHAKKLGSTFKNPFITCAFMALLVIPSLKISDKGLFDSAQFTFSNLIIEERT